MYIFSNRNYKVDFLQYILQLKLIWSNIRLYIHGKQMKTRKGDNPY